MTKFYLTLCCLLTAFAPAAAQQLTGVVTDNNGEPLFGAVAALKGKTAATTTSVRGEYALQGVDLRRDTLVFTYVGMKKLEVPVAGRTKVDVRLEVMNTAINEVVVIGYGTMRRADLTGAVSSVSSEEIVRTPVNNIAEAISGKLAGVQVLTTDGAPDAEVSMYVRGRNSITQSSSPLYAGRQRRHHGHDQERPAERREGVVQRLCGTEIRDPDARHARPLRVRPLAVRTVGLPELRQLDVRALFRRLRRHAPL